MDSDLKNGGQGDGTQNLSVFSDPHRIESDLNMLRRSVRAEWPVPEAIRPALIQRLINIAEKVGVNVRVDDEGNMVTLDAPADANAIKAIALLNMMTAQDASTRMEIAKMIRGGEKGTTVNVGVQVAPIVYKGVDPTAI